MYIYSPNVLAAFLQIQSTRKSSTTTLLCFFTRSGQAHLGLWVWLCCIWTCPAPISLCSGFHVILDAESRRLSHTWYPHPNKIICCTEGKCAAKPPLGFFRNWPRPNKSSAALHLTSHHRALTIRPEQVSCICCPNWPVLGDTTRSLHVTSHGT